MRLARRSSPTTAPATRRPPSRWIAEHFIVGNDETNALAVYLRGQPAPAATVQLGKFLGLGGKDEADIEGAAPLGKRIYWITSHARDSKGRAQPDRQRFFATEVVAGPTPRVAPVGRPYARLLDDMLAAPALAPYGLAAASRLPAEAEGGFNIEGLAATPDGRLLIGLRNPLPRGRALLIPLENPADVIDHGQRARLGAPIELDLGQRGIRSIERVGDAYVIVAGPAGRPRQLRAVSLVRAGAGRADTRRRRRRSATCAPRRCSPCRAAASCSCSATTVACPSAAPSARICRSRGRPSAA